MYDFYFNFAKKVLNFMKQSGNYRTQAHVNNAYRHFDYVDFTIQMNIFLND